MIPGLSSLPETLQNLISKNFFVTGFMPVVLFGIASLWPISILYPETWQLVLGLFEDTEVLSTEFALLLLIVIVVAYIVWSLRTFFREILEGRYLWQSAREILTSHQTAFWQRLEEKCKALRPDRTQLRRVAAMNLFEARNVEEDTADEHTLQRSQEQWVNILHDALTGVDITAQGNAPTGEEDLADLSMSMQALRQRRDRHESISYAELEKCCNDILKHCKRENRTQLSAVGNQVLVESAQELPFLSQYALARVERDYAASSSLLRYRFPNDHFTIGPTAMANMAEIQRAYAFDRYGIDIDVVRPRLQTLISEDPEFSNVLDTTQVHLDINVMMTTLSFAYGLVWFWQLAAFSDDFLHYLIVIAGSAAATVVFYALAVRAYRRHGEVLRSAVDLFRFGLLEKLHIGLPANSIEEKSLWEQLMRHIVLGGGIELDYDHGDEEGLFEEDDLGNEFEGDDDQSVLEAVRQELREFFERFSR